MKNRWLIFAAIILAFTLASSGAYNGLVNSREEALVKAEDIDLHIKEMSSLVKSSIDPVSIYAEYETDAMIDILEASDMLSKAKTMKEKANALGKVYAAVDNLELVSQNYPDLKADPNYILISDAIAERTKRLNVSKIDYNATVGMYNDKVVTFPSSVFANAMDMEEFEFFRAAEAVK